MNGFLDAISGVLVLLGSALALTAAMGVVRFPDTLARMHAASNHRCWGCCWSWPVPPCGYADMPTSA